MLAMDLHGDATKWVPLSSAALWLVATALLALSPLLFFASGAVDGSGRASRILVGAVPALVAWPLLVLALGLARRRRGLATGFVTWPAAGRALILMALASGLFAVAYVLGSGPVIEGDSAWGAYWGAAGAAWVALSAASL